MKNKDQIMQEKIKEQITNNNEISDAELDSVVGGLVRPIRPISPYPQKNNKTPVDC